MADEPPEMIDSPFRNGSLTAIGVVLGFSLGFLSQWAALPGTWEWNDRIAATVIIIGIGLQIKAVASLLSVKSLILTNYNRAVRIFLIGLILVAAGVIIAIFLDIVGIGQNVFRH